MSIQVKTHPYYENPKFENERKVLEGLVKICGFDETVGFLDHHDIDGPLEIGIIDNDVTGAYPVFKENTGVIINLHYLYSENRDPIILKEEPTLESLQKIIEPLKVNWYEVATLLINTYEKGWGKRHCKNNLENWRKEISS